MFQSQMTNIAGTFSKKKGIFRIGVLAIAAVELVLHTGT